MKYERWYNSIVENAKKRNWNKNDSEHYLEAHHVVPRCFGGSNTKDNIILLTAREHFICHLLLVKIHTQPDEKVKMIYALYRMCGIINDDRKVMSSRWFESVRRMMSLGCSGKNHPQYGTTHPSKGVPRTQDVREKIRKSLTGKKLGPQSKQARLKKRLTQRASDIIIEDKKFLSLSHASEELNINRDTIRYRLKSPNWPNYKRENYVEKHQ
jgi:hypothetical protein